MRLALLIRAALSAALLTALLPAATAHAATLYGAIYFSPSTNANGYSYNHRSKSDAEWAAYNACSENADDCVKAIGFRNACGALAVGNGGWGADWGVNGNQAQAKAMRSCRDYAERCRVIRWQCTS